VSKRSDPITQWSGPAAAEIEAAMPQSEAAGIVTPQPA